MIKKAGILVNSHMLVSSGKSVYDADIRMRTKDNAKSVRKFRFRSKGGSTGRPITPNAGAAQRVKCEWLQQGFRCRLDTFIMLRDHHTA